MTERSSEEIRREIERTRERMDEKADALEQKLTPGEIIDDLWNRIRRGDAASGLGDMFRDHPVPIALMGLGLGWLAIERTTGSRGDRLRRRYGDVAPGTYEAAEGRRGPYLPDDVSLRGAEGEGGGIGEKMGEMKDQASGAMHRAADAMHGARERAGGAMEGMRERAGGMRDAASRTGESARDVASGVGHRAREAMEEGRYRAQQARRGMSQMMDEHPLALAAVAFGAGLAAGVSAPSTRVEDRLMGDAADAAKDEMKDAGRRTADQVKSVAQDTAEAAKDEISRQGGEADLAGRAERVVDRAAETAKRRGREEGLMAEGREKDRPSKGGTGQPG